MNAQETFASTRVYSRSRSECTVARGSVRARRKPGVRDVGAEDDVTLLNGVGHDRDDRIVDEVEVLERVSQGTTTQEVRTGQFVSVAEVGHGRTGDAVGSTERED